MAPASLSVLDCLSSTCAAAAAASKQITRHTLAKDEEQGCPCRWAILDASSLFQSTNLFRSTETNSGNEAGALRPRRLGALPSKSGAFELSEGRLHSAGQPTVWHRRLEGFAASP